jgi:CPA1 family monovalent cation:H+ antiporter
MCPIIGAEFTSRLADGPTNAQARDPTHGLQRANELRRLAVEAARHAVLAMRASLEIGDDAFHQVEEELNWLEMATRERPE